MINDLIFLLTQLFELNMKPHTPEPEILTESSFEEPPELDEDEYQMPNLASQPALQRPPIL